MQLSHTPSLHAGSCSRQQLVTPLLAPFPARSPTTSRRRYKYYDITSCQQAALSPLQDLCHSPTSQFTSILSPQPSFKPGSRNVRIEITGPSFCVYRTMEVREGDRAGRFVRKAMKKHGIQGDPLQYQLVMKCECESVMNASVTGPVPGIHPSPYFLFPL